VTCLYDRASQSPDRGNVTGYDAEVIADALGFETDEVERIIAALNDKGIIDGGRIAAWEKYQPKREDGSAERAKAHRERNRTQANATEPDRPLETDTEVEGDSEKKDGSIIHLNSSAPPRQRTATKPFPSDGSICFGHWATVARQARSGIDPDALADPFRQFCRNHDPPIPLDHELIEKRFIGFAKSHRFSRRA
jgi:hypothetical protein